MPGPDRGTRRTRPGGAERPGLYRSKNKGLTSQRWGSGLPLVSVTDIWIASDGSMYRVGTYGRGVWQLGAFGFNNQ